MAEGEWILHVGRHDCDSDRHCDYCCCGGGVPPDESGTEDEGGRWREGQEDDQDDHQEAYEECEGLVALKCLLDHWCIIVVIGDSKNRLQCWNH